MAPPFGKQPRPKQVEGIHHRLVGPGAYLALRGLVSFGIFLRFLIHGHEVDGLLVSATFLWLASFALAAAAYRTREKHRRTRIAQWTVSLDVVALCLFHRATGVVESDFYLFFVVPILTAAEYLSQRAVLATTGGAAVAFFAVVFATPTDLTDVRTQWYELLIRVFLPRALFFFGPTLLLALRIRQEQDVTVSATSETREAQSLLRSRHELDRLFEPPQVLQAVLEQAVRDQPGWRAVGILGPRGGSASKESVCHAPARQDPDEAALDACREILAGNQSAGAIALTQRGQTIGAIAIREANGNLIPERSTGMWARAEHITSACAREELFKALREIGNAALTIVTLDEVMESMLNYLVDHLGVEHATISLVDDYQRRIRAVRARNVPPGWLARAVHSLDDRDIQSHVVISGESTPVLTGYDPLFDRHIWERYNHDRLARVFAPIKHENKVVGTIEAACDKSRQNVVLSRANVAAITRLGIERGRQIAERLPHVLLELIAKKAIELIGADSASIHVYQGVWLDKRQILLAGAGDLPENFLYLHPPSDKGLGSKAINLGRRQSLDEVPPERQELLDKGVRAMAAFPLRVSDEVFGLLYVHYKSRHEFLESELELVDVLVPQVELAIRNHLVLDDIFRADARTSVIMELQNVLRTVSSARDFDQLLDELVDHALQMLDATNVTLYQYSEQEECFLNQAIAKGEFKHKEQMRDDVRSDDIVHVSIKEREPKFISKIHEDAPYLLKPREDAKDKRPRFAEREGIRSCAILVLKAPPDGEVVGCLFVNYAEEKDFRSAENRGLRQLAISVASAVAVGIKIARLHNRVERDLERSRAELKALRAVNRSIAKNLREPDLRQTCDEVLRQAQDLLGVEVGDVTIWKPQEKLLEVVSQRGYPDNGPVRGVPLGTGVVGMVGKTKRPLRLDSIAGVDYYRCVHPGTQSEMAYPMLDQSTRDLLGVINVEHHKRKAFSERDQEFLRTLAVQGAIAIHTLYSHERLQLQLRNARCLTKVAARVQLAQSEQDQSKRERTIFSLLLTGLTAKQGLGFSRAVLFLPEPGGTHCRGAMARGALSLKASEENWQRLTHEEGTCSSDDFLDLLLSRSATEAIHEEATADELSKVVKGMALELPTDTESPHTRWAKHANQPEFLYSSDPHPLVRQLKGLYPDDKRLALAFVPIGRHAPIALILLDRSFIHDEQDIDPLYEAAIRAFAELASTSIESSRARALSDTRWAAHAIAHSLKKTFVAMQQESGTARSLLRTRSLNPDLHQRLSSLDNHFKAMDDLLEDIDAVGQPKALVRHAFDLNSELKEIVKTHQPVYRSCKLSLELPEDNVILVADRSQLKRMVLELWSNADRALLEAGTSEAQIRMNVTLGAKDIALSVCDNGPGIAPHIVGRQYDPFISGYHSSGVGLAIVHDSVLRHGGRIDYAQMNPGAQFTVTLPLESHDSVPAPMVIPT